LPDHSEHSELNAAATLAAAQEEERAQLEHDALNQDDNDQAHHADGDDSHDTRSTKSDVDDRAKRRNI
jgi:hypothetical protein